MALMICSLAGLSKLSKCDANQKQQQNVQIATKSLLPYSCRAVCVSCAANWTRP